MKMMNNDIEFIAFDAQDVIATSGPYDNVTKVRFCGSVGKEYNEAHGGFDFGHTKGEAYQTLTKYFAYDLENMPADETGKYWTADSSANNLDASNSDQIGYTLLETAADIVSWLKSNGYTPHQ